MNPETDFKLNEEHFVPSLLQAVRNRHLDGAKLTVALAAGGTGPLTASGRQDVILYDGRLLGQWKVASLREMFRGDAPAPKEMK